MRLIDADELLKIINDDIEITSKCVNNDEKNSSCHHVGKGELNTLECYRGIVEDLPTVYDPDKVVEQLREKAKMNLEKGLSEIIPVKARPYLEAHNVLYDAIEIVEAGGIE